jgi:hypothetical protein
MTALLVAAAAGSSGCRTTPETPEYPKSVRHQLERGLEHDFLVRVKPWERDVLARNDMAWDPDRLQAARRAHIFFSKEASLVGGGAGGGGCGCN